MYQRIQHVSTPIGWRTLTVRQSHVEGRDVYAGAIDGRDCVRASTREGAVSALLRRAVQRGIQ